MKWPFALRSTVDMLQSLLRLADRRTRLWHHIYENSKLDLEDAHDRIDVLEEGVREARLLVADDDPQTLAVYLAGLVD